MATSTTRTRKWAALGLMAGALLQFSGCFLRLEQIIEFFFASNALDTINRIPLLGL